MIYEGNTGIIVTNEQAVELLKRPGYSRMPDGRVERTFTLSESAYQARINSVEAEIVETAIDKDAEKKAKKAEYMRKKRAAAKAAKKED